MIWNLEEFRPISGCETDMKMALTVSKAGIRLTRSAWKAIGCPLRVCLMVDARQEVLALSPARTGAGTLKVSGRIERGDGVVCSSVVTRQVCRLAGQDLGNVVSFRLPLVFDCTQDALFAEFAKAFDIRPRGSKA